MNLQLLTLLTIVNLTFGSAVYARPCASLDTLKSAITIPECSLKPARQIDKKELNHFLEQGNLHLGRREYKQAICDFSKAIESDHNSACAYLGRGKCLGALSRDNEAIVDLSKSIALCSFNAEAFGYRAESVAALGNNTKALSDYNRSIAIDDRNPWAFVGRAEVQVNLNKNLEAISDCNHLLTLLPNDRRVLFDKANAERQMGNFEAAASDYYSAAREEIRTPESIYVKSFCMLVSAFAAFGCIAMVPFIRE